MCVCVCVCVSVIACVCVLCVCVCAHTLAPLSEEVFVFVCMCGVRASLTCRPLLTECPAGVDRSVQPQPS